MPQVDPSTQEGPTPAVVWSALDAATREAAARALFSSRWDDGAARREANHAIAGALRFRPAAVQQLPIERRVDYLLKAVHPDDSLAHSLLMAFHLEHRRPLLSAFLGALGIPAEDGLIDPDHELVAPAGERLDAAVARLRADFPREEVELYLRCLLAMDPEVWGGLARHLAPA